MSDDRVSRLEKQVRALRGYAALLTAILGVLVVHGARGENQGAEVLRVRGIIVEDAQGRERILIGAPIPEAANRADGTT